MKREKKRAERLRKLKRDPYASKQFEPEPEDDSPATLELGHGAPEHNAGGGDRIIRSAKGMEG